MDALQKVKAELKKRVSGKVMVRKDNSYPGLEQKGIFTYNVYFDNPSPNVKEAIKGVIESHGFQAMNFRIIGGAYGYVIPFTTEKR
ncbi:hypothetical protein [Bacillus mycoides]|uniref:hypothetical protein n=1 Tax=Bacillus mycoides TaxID=1405 RepID=UPI003A8044E2